MFLDRSTNIQRLISLLTRAYPDGMTSGEMAAELGVSSQTIRNLIEKLEHSGVHFYQEKQRYAIDPETIKQPLELSMAEAWMLYLAQRRLIRAQQNRFPVIRALINKLAPLIHHQLSEYIQAIETSLEQPDTFSILITGWQYRRVVRVSYRPLDGQPRQMNVAPWWFEPAVWSDSNYCIAGTGPNLDRPVTLKIDRVLQARLMDDTFPHQRIDELMQRIEASWGIWTSEHPQKVVLRFAARLYDRMHETVWHPTQEIKISPDGDIIWSAVVAEVQEMKPWIRGWGADVEVLEPSSLREEIITEIKKQLNMYQPDDDGQRSFF